MSRLLRKGRHATTQVAWKSGYTKDAPCAPCCLLMKHLHCFRLPAQNCGMESYSRSFHSSNISSQKPLPGKELEIPSVEEHSIRKRSTRGRRRRRPTPKRPTRQSSRKSSSASKRSPSPKVSSSKTTDNSSILKPIMNGPTTTFGTGTIANLTESSVVGTAGETVVLATVAVSTKSKPEMSASTAISSSEANIAKLASHLRNLCSETSSEQHMALTVHYRQRFHAVGKIPTHSRRADNRQPSELEILASRAIDRSLRPLFRINNGGNDGAASNADEVESVQVNCSVQACPLSRQSSRAAVEDGGQGDPNDPQYDALMKGGHPIALAINAASVAMKEKLKERVGCVYLCVMEDGTILINPPQSRSDASCELLYAGTRTRVVMMEYSGRLPKSQLIELIQLSHQHIQSLIDAQEGIINSDRRKIASSGAQIHALREQSSVDIKVDPHLRLDDIDIDDDTLRRSLGLICSQQKDADATILEEGEANEKEARAILKQAIQFCQNQLGEATLRLFGWTGDTGGTGQEKVTQDRSVPRVSIHNNSEQGPLLSKSLRGRREHLVRTEISRLLLEEFEPESNLIQPFEIRKLLQDDPRLMQYFSDVVHSTLLRSNLFRTAQVYGCRADGRREKDGANTNGCEMIRPISIAVPALPDSVHGSALFARGETQVLCTTTLGPPRDGILISDPFVHKGEEPAGAALQVDGNDAAFRDLPVGSLRYLKHQEHLESDLNTRKSLADREQTGDSGTLRERRRAFLQYDFPSYSKGEVNQGHSTAANRREIGHGALAEKAILPILPNTSDFPYAIRMTSEVTSSNGSSSMASVCGATLSLLDAGVPLKAPAAGVSVGLAIAEDFSDDNDNGTSRLLLDITGSEDYYGALDCKIAGTKDELTAIQLDVKEPLPLELVSEALDLGSQGLRVILDEMEAQTRDSTDGIISNLRPRPKFKETAPRVEVIRYDPARKRDLLGPGGAVIRQMEDRYDVSLDLTQDGKCLLFGEDQDMVKKAKSAVMDLVADVVVGGVYEGTVIEMRDFGIIVELLRNKEGLLHVSELAGRDDIKSHRLGALGVVKDVTDVGEKIEVLVTAVDPVHGTIRLKPASNEP